MLTLLFLLIGICVLAVVGFAVGIVALPFVVIALVIGFVFSILAIIFKLVFGLPGLIIVIILAGIFYSKKKRY